jgi:hypothetical protein
VRRRWSLLKSWFFPFCAPFADETRNVPNKISVAETRRCTVKKNLLLSLVMLAFVSPGLAGADCLQEGKVARLRSGTVGNVVDIQNLSLSIPSFDTFYTVPTDRFYAMLAAAQAGNLSVNVTGDAASCPTTGTFGSGGNVIAVDIAKND